MKASVYLKLQADFNFNLSSRGYQYVLSPAIPSFNSIHLEKNSDDLHHIRHKLSGWRCGYSLLV